MKKALAVLMAAVVACAASFFRLSFFHNIPVRYLLGVDENEISEIGLYNPRGAWETQEEAVIQEILDDLYGFRYSVKYYRNSPQYSGGGGYTLTLGSQRFELAPDGIMIRDIWYFGENGDASTGYFEELLQRAGGWYRP